MSSGDFPLIYIVGPTATGKTALGIALAREFGGEIINADSRQVYRYMDIGTAKPGPEERDSVPHHLFDLLTPDQNFSLGSFLSLAPARIDEIAGRGKLPIVVGGTGQYVWALHEGWNVPEIPPDADFRRRLEEEAAIHGGERLHSRLMDIDPQRANELDPRNVRRVIRALEIHHLTGLKPASIQPNTTNTRAGLVIGLNTKRDLLYHRIDERVDRMMADGFFKEVETLAAMGYTLGSGPLACPGYRELGQHLRGEVSLEEAVQRTKFQTHRMVRRQNTWFKPGDARISWLEATRDDLVRAAGALVAGFS